MLFFNGRSFKTTDKPYPVKKVQSLYLMYGDYVFSFVYAISGEKSHSFEVTRLSFMELYYKVKHQPGEHISDIDLFRCVINIYKHVTSGHNEERFDCNDSRPHQFSDLNLNTRIVTLLYSYRLFTVSQIAEIMDDSVENTEDHLRKGFTHLGLLSRRSP